MVDIFDFIHSYNVAPVKKALDDNPLLWGQFSARRLAPSSPHSGMTDIWVRYNDIRKFETSLEGFNDEHIPIWYPAWLVLRESIGPIVFDLMRRVEGEMLGGVLITKIPPGGRIGSHKDKSWHVDYFNRKFYTSISSAPGAFFYSGNHRLCPRTGETWEFDNHLEHRVENNSEVDRITLITCIHTDMV